MSKSDNSDILIVQNLTHIYTTDAEPVKAVDNINLKVKKSSFISITGRSGSGKTTLLHLIAGLIKPTSGEIYINGEEITSLDEEPMTLFRRCGIGLVFQSYNLIQHLSVLDNILLPKNLDNAAVNEELFRNIISSLDLKEKLKKKPNHLSGGEQQRVAIARAMMIQPFLLLADEPTGNLDKKTGDAVFALLSLMRDEFGQTIILVTHDESMAEKTDQIIHLESGRMNGVAKNDE